MRPENKKKKKNFAGYFQSRFGWGPGRASGLQQDPKADNSRVAVSNADCRSHTECDFGNDRSSEQYQAAGCVSLARYDFLLVLCGDFRSK